MSKLKNEKWSGRFCTFNNCTKQASFGVEGTKHKEFCKKHKLDHHVNLMAKVCKFDGCCVTPSYGPIGTKKREYCKEHRLENYVDVISTFCKAPGCKTRATFKLINTKHPVFCEIHVPSADYVSATFKKCEKCSKPAYYGIFGTKNNAFCFDHKSEMHVNVMIKLCEFPQCSTKASFGSPGDIKNAKYCSEHKESHHINLKDKLCIVDGCKKYAMHALNSSTRPTLCSEHKKNGYVNVISKLCKFPGCELTATFALSKTEKAEYCKKHKSDLHFQVGRATCSFKNCITRACFGKYEPLNEKQIPQFCFSHKLDDHINLTKKNKECLEKNCTKEASFGELGGKPSYCFTHKKNGHVDVKHKKCEIINCTERAHYGKIGHPKIHCLGHKEKNEIMNPNPDCKYDNQNRKCKNKAIYGINKLLHCELHKGENEINLTEQNCKKCGLPDILDNEGHCNFCNPKTIEYVRLAKQKKVKDYLDLHLPEDKKYFSYDKMIDKGECGKERPDFLFNCINSYICLEVDELQHKDRNCECEITRMVNISQSLALPTLFIRFNPDEYKTINGRPPLKEQDRHQELLNQILYWYDNFQNLDIFCGVTYLFFDNDNPSNHKNITPLLKSEPTLENLA